MLVAEEGATFANLPAEHETVWKDIMPSHAFRASAPAAGAATASAQASQNSLPRAEDGTPSKLTRMDAAALANMDAMAGAAFTAESDTDSEVRSPF
jgi:hypothetical protein